MTIAEQLRQEGRQEGQEFVATQMLLRGMSLNEVAELTQLSIDRLKALQDQQKH